MVNALDADALLATVGTWTDEELAHALAAFKLHEDSATRKLLKKELTTRAPDALDAVQEAFRGAISWDDKKFTKKLSSMDPERIDRNQFARAAFAWSRGHIGFAFRLEQGGAVALEALHDDLKDGAMTVAKAVPELLPQVDGLRSLHLMKIRGKRLSDVVSQLTSLTELKLTKCNIDSFASALLPLRSLKVLHCHDVPLSKGLGRLPAGLQRLWVHYTSLNTLEELCQDHIVELNVTNTPNSMPPAIGAMSALRNLSWQRAGELPDELFSLKMLEDLDLSLWQHEELPNKFLGLPNIKSLHFRGCASLKALPPSIASLTRLSHLDLAGCSSIAEIPSWLSELSIERIRIGRSPWQHQEERLRELVPGIEIYQ